MQNGVSCMTEDERRIYENCRNVAHGHGRQTNFAHITASPEALAEFIIDKLQYCKRPVCPICPVWKKCDGVSKEAFVKWLKRESE